MKILSVIILILSVQTSFAADKNLACEYHPSKRLATLLKQIKKTSSESFAVRDISLNQNQCASIKNENITSYFKRSLDACNSGCKRGSAGKNTPPVVHEFNIEKCMMRCAQAYDASIGEAVAYQNGRNEALGECKSTATTTGSAPAVAR